MTTSIKDPLEAARTEAQQLHQRLDTAMGSQTTALRAELQRSVAHAEALAGTLRESVAKQSAQAKRHTEEAADALRDATEKAKFAAQASEAKLQGDAAAVAARVRDGLTHISQAVAKNRAAATAGKK